MEIQLVIKKPILRAYLHHLFPLLEDGSFQVSKHVDFGSALCSFVHYSHNAIEKPGHIFERKKAEHLSRFQAKKEKCESERELAELVEKYQQDLRRIGEEFEQMEEQTVRFQLPHVNSLSNARSYHLYYPKDFQLKLNDMLQLIFNLDFDRYYLAGKKTGEQQKDIIMSFVATRKLSKLLTDPETLKKRQYREELQLLESRVKKLINQAYYRNDRIEYHHRILYAS